MKALRLAEFGAPPSVADIEMPEPGPGEARVRIAACGLNFADLLTVEGKYQERPQLPATLGMELAGTVDALGPGVDSPKVGSRVAVFAGQGGLAESGCFPAERCSEIPDSMPFDDAAALQIAYGTGHLALDRRAALQPGETLLVLGAAGGVGLAAVELGKAMGARVVASARGEERLAVARDAGADHLVDSGPGDLRDRVRELGGADVIFDPVGGDQFDAALRAANPEARAIVIGFASGRIPQIPANILLVKNVSAIGFYWGGYLAFRPKALDESLATLFQWHSVGKISPRIGARLPLDRAAEALELLASRKSTGKIVVVMP